MFQELFVAGEVGDAVKALLQVGVVELAEDVGRGVVQLLLYQLIAENAVQLPGRHGLEGAGVQQGSGLVFHIGPHIVPCGGQLRFFQIKAEKAKSYYCLKPVREG